MKIKPDHLETLRAACAQVLADKPHAAASYAAAGLTHKRFRWDVLRATRIKIGDGVGIRGDLDLYAYMNDDHIDTALRAVVPAF